MLNQFPPRLNALYGRIINQIRSSKRAELCKRILAVISTVYQHITLDELASFVDMPGDYEDLAGIIGLCSSFLTLRERTILFVH